MGSGHAEAGHLFAICCHCSSSFVGFADAIILIICTLCILPALLGDYIPRTEHSLHLNHMWQAVYHVTRGLASTGLLRQGCMMCPCLISV